MWTFLAQILCKSCRSDFSTWLHPSHAEHVKVCSDPAAGVSAVGSGAIFRAKCNFADKSHSGIWRESKFVQCESCRRQFENGAVPLPRVTVSLLIPEGLGVDFWIWCWKPDVLHSNLILVYQMGFMNVILLSFCALFCRFAFQNSRSISPWLQFFHVCGLVLQRWGTGGIWSDHAVHGVGMCTHQPLSDGKAAISLGWLKWVFFIWPAWSRKSNNSQIYEVRIRFRGGSLRVLLMVNQQKLRKSRPGIKKAHLISDLLFLVKPHVQMFSKICPMQKTLQWILDLFPHCFMFCWEWISFLLQPQWWKESRVKRLAGHTSTGETTFHPILAVRENEFRFESTKAEVNWIFWVTCSQELTISVCSSFHHISLLVQVFLVPHPHLCWIDALHQWCDACEFLIFTQKAHWDWTMNDILQGSLMSRWTFACATVGCRMFSPVNEPSRQPCLKLWSSFTCKSTLR